MTAKSENGSKTAQSSAAVDYNSVKLLTYNFFLRPPFISDYKGDSKNERLDEFIESVLPNYDIFALQETFAGYSSRVRKLEIAAGHAGFVSHYRGPGGSVASGHLIDSGLLILSKWPIKEHARVLYSRGTTVDRLASKGATYTLHIHPQRPDVRLHLFSTHLQASYSTAPKIDDPSVQCRLQQIRELADFIHQQLSVHWAGGWPGKAHTDSGVIPAATPISEKAEHDGILPSEPASPSIDKTPIDLGESAAPAAAPLDGNECPSTPEPSPGYQVVLLAGDMNVNSMQQGQEEYHAMMQILSRNGMFHVTDVLQAQGRADYTHVPWVWLSKRRAELSRSVLERESGRLDYFLLIEPRREVSHAIDTRIETLPAQNPAFLQLSDHMGVSATVTLPKTSLPEASK